jgi:hypothetical protein
VVIRSGNRFRTADSLEAAKALITKKDGPAMDFSPGYFDLFPDGRLGPDAEISLMIDPAISFPRLRVSSSKIEWRQRDHRTGQEYKYSQLRCEPEGWAFLVGRRQRTSMACHWLIRSMPNSSVMFCPSKCKLVRAQFGDPGAHARHDSCIP